MFTSFPVALGMVTSAFLIALAVALFVLVLRPARTAEAGDLSATAPAASVFLFKERELLDATPMARALLQDIAGFTTDWDRMMGRLLPLFPDLATALEGLRDRGHLLLATPQGINPPLALRLEWRQGLTRIALMPADQNEKNALIDLGSEVALQEELLALRRAMVEMPVPAWRESAAGEIIWANAAYLHLLFERQPQDQPLPWPLPAVFARPLAKGARLHLPREGERGAWYELIELPLAEQDLMVYAMPVDQIVSAERHLRDFTQTMTRTFAQLPCAVAIFDAEGILQIFNPALADMTGLPVAFLVARPSFAMVLDALRERRMIPEPRDYSAWRRQMVEMEGAALTGVFTENWTLASGQVFRITAMPQATGSMAFLMENVTEEVGKLRRLRSELALCQSVIDMMPEAVVVLSPMGELALSNKAARDLWGLEQSGDPFAQARKQAASSPLWEELAAFHAPYGPREAFERLLRLKDGRSFKVAVAAAYGGAALVKFTPQDLAAPALVGGDLAMQMARG